jgi:ubiquitin-small subunit ribosomal protein S27Ae
MHIFVQTLTGKTCSLKVDNNSQIENIHSEIETIMGVPSLEQKLIFNGKRLETGKSINDYEILENSNIYLVIDLEGGAKGKKKKKDTKKGKKKHKKRKVKLAILKYYKVEGDKVVRLRQMCKVCPAGTFLAEHADRLHCGRCNTGYVKVGGDTGKKGAAAGGKEQAAAKKGGKK